MRDKLKNILNNSNSISYKIPKEINNKIDLIQKTIIQI